MFQIGHLIGFVAVGFAFLLGNYHGYEKGYREGSRKYWEAMHLAFYTYFSKNIETYLKAAKLELAQSLWYNEDKKHYYCTLAMSQRDLQELTKIELAKLGVKDEGI